ncbi:MAG: VacJ family lipoprotein [Desulforhopalus sp.]|nr:VacJ family lipoprotein [Desulforhopalus sp.]
MNAMRFFAVLILFVVLSCSHVAADDQADSLALPDLLADEFDFDEDLDEPPGGTFSDPLEPMNRVFFEVNDLLYDYALRPVANGYAWVLPKEIRQFVGNFFRNIATPIPLLNSLLQFDFETSGVVLGRFVLNSTIGVFGLVDVADLEFGMPPRRADFGQTLGRWGFGDGIYLCWPLLGPSSVRDSVGLGVDTLAHPVQYFYQSVPLDVTYYATQQVNELSLDPDTYEDLRRYSFDPYVAARQAYYEYRKNFVAVKQSR